jgi:hypothetical protein
MAWPDRHGRWPLAAAAAAPPVTAVMLARREDFVAGGAWMSWLPLPALLWHQAEEWVRPGGFLPWFNREVMDSGEDEFPITRRDGLLINAGLGWGLALATGLSRSPALASCQLAMDLANAGLHGSQLVLRRRYNPGSVTALVMFVPLGIAGLRRLLRREPRREVLAGAAAGLVASAGLMVAMRRRAAA